MPQLKEYDAPTLGLNPSDRGTDARLQAARRTGAFYNEAAGLIEGGARAQANAADDVTRSVAGIAGGVTDAVKIYEDYAGHKEISKGAAAGAQLFSDLTDQWDKTVKSADPNDPAVAAKFREQVLEPSLQKFSEAYSNTGISQRWAEQHVASMRNHFFQKTSADMSTLAAQAVETNFRQTSNSLQTAAYKSPDFHSVDYSLSQVDSSIGAIIDSSNVKGVEAGKLRNALTEKTKEGIVKAAVAGAISKADDPEKVAATYAQRYPQYINGPEMAAFAKAAKNQAKVNAYHDKQIETYERQQQDRAVHAGSAKIMTDNVSFDDNGRPSVKPEYFKQSLDLARQFPDAPSTAATVHSMITWGEHQQNQRAQAVTDNPAVKADLLTRMFDPTNPTTDVQLRHADIKGELGPGTFAKLHGLWTSLQETPLKGEVMKDTLAAVKADLTYSMPGLPGRDPNGLKAHAAFIQQFIPEYIRLYRAGTLQPNALDLRDPKSLISQTMAPFKRSPADMLRDRVEELVKLNLTGPGKEITGSEVIDIPAGMTPADAVKKFGAGKPFRLPDGRTGTLK